MRGELASQPDNDTHDERRARTPPIMNPLMAVMEYLMVGGERLSIHILSSNLTYAKFWFHAHLAIYQAKASGV